MSSVVTMLTMKRTPTILLFTICLIQASLQLPCIKKNEGLETLEHIVCVCNATYCDTVDELGVVPAGTGVLYTSSKAGLRVQRTVIKAGSSFGSSQITLNLKKSYQTIHGFGGAFTDSTGINLMTLPKTMQDSIIQGYFGPGSIGYTIGRVPIASTDFSTHEYSYDDVDGDMDLTNFNLTLEDYNYKLPYIKQAIQLAGSDLKLFCSPWSAPVLYSLCPSWRTVIDGPYYTVWKNYIMKFLSSYHNEGIDFWVMTLQNEPTTGRVKNYKWQTMFFNASMQRDFIKTLMGPALKANPLTSNINVMIMDDQRFNLPEWPNVVLKDPEAAKYISGIAIHWYEDQEVPPSVLTTTHTLHPNYWMLGTEACTGFEPGQHKPILGDWARAQDYAHDIITDLNNYVTGWTDWNLCLDMKGGPNWVGNNVDSPIIINAAKKEYYKQPMWYTMAHFSKFMRPGSVRVFAASTNVPGTVEYTPFMTPEGNKGIILLNKGTATFSTSLTDTQNLQNLYNIEVPAKSLITFIFN